MRSAYTIIELICVLAIIVIIGSIAIPTTQVQLANARVSAAADQVRARVSDARARALEQGRPWKLGFIPGSGMFQLAPEDSQEWTGASQNEVKKTDLIREKLPKDVIFGLQKEDVQGATGASSSAAGKWETIAVYTWDGSAREDSTVYFGKGGWVPMRVTIRGLTGTVSIENYRETP